MSNFKLKLKSKSSPENISFKEEKKENVVPFEMKKPQDALHQEADELRETIKKSYADFKLGDNKKVKVEEKKKQKTRSNKYFYRVSNHHELFKIGRSFYNDYLSGVKSFAITSTGYQTSQQKTILGLASFFDHKEDLKIGIISDNLYYGVFKDIVDISKKVNYDFFGKESSYTIHSFYNHFEFIDLNEIIQASENYGESREESIIDHIVDNYDLVLWDVPELHKIQQSSETYFPVIMKYESISIIVAKSLSKKTDIDDIQKFFIGYGINLKGLLLEDLSGKDEEEAEVKEEKGQDDKKSWWRAIFKG